MTIAMATIPLEPGSRVSEAADPRWPAHSSVPVPNGAIATPSRRFAVRASEVSTQHPPEQSAASLGAFTIVRARLAQRQGHWFA
jgi:hypothetical protein